MEKLLVRPMEVAEALGVSRSKIYELIASGAMPSVRIGKSVRVSVDELRKWVRSHSSGSQTDIDRPQAGPEGVSR
jgi:excisionase family DNA binding protein